jgi:hypothetical protein
MGRAKTLYNTDIYNENFDHYLQIKLENISPQQKELLPDSLNYKIFKYGKTVVSDLSFTEKIYILSVCFRQSVAIVIQDEEAGIGPSEFQMASKAQSAKATNGELLDQLDRQSAFVLADKDLIRSLLYMNHVQCTDIYNLIKIANPRDKTKRELQNTEYKKAYNSIVKMLVHYEGNKKKFIGQFNISVPKLFALLYCFDGEKSSRDFYEKAFKYSYTSNRADLGRALTELYEGGYLDKRGSRRYMRYSITARGMVFLQTILEKLIFSY